jgi:hypothetical protein
MRLSNLDPASLDRIASLANAPASARLAATSRRMRNVTHPTVRRHRVSHKAVRRWVNATIGAPRKIAQELLELARASSDRQSFRVLVASKGWKQIKIRDGPRYIYYWTKRYNDTYIVKLANHGFALHATVFVTTPDDHKSFLVAIYRKWGGGGGLSHGTAKPSDDYYHHLFNGTVSANMQQKMERLKNAASDVFGKAMDLYTN